MPNPIFTYILNIGFINTFCRYTVKWSKISISSNLACHLFALSLNDQTVLFDP